jgi:hypothetical protein
MALIDIIGVETGDTSEFASTSGTVSVVTTPVRTGSVYALRSNPTTNSTGYAACPASFSTAGLPQNILAGTTYYFRFYFRAATLPAANEEPICVAVDAISNVKFRLNITSGGILKFYNTSNTLLATGTTALSTNAWYCIIIYANSGASVSWEVRLAPDDETTPATEISGSGADLGSNAFSSFRIGKAINVNSQTVDFYYDDMLLDDANWPTQGTCVRLAPNGDGSTAQWTAGTAADYTAVDEVPTDGDTSYIQKSAGSSQAHLVALESTTTKSISGTVNGVKAYIRPREGGNVTSATLVRIRSGGTNSDSATRNGNTTYVPQFRVRDTDPSTSSAWTLSAIDSLEVGIADTGSASNVRCSTIAAFVDFTPDAGPPPDYTPLDMFGVCGFFGI